MPKFEISNNLDTRMILHSLRQYEESESSYSHLTVAGLYNTKVSATGFMGSNPNDQIRYAAENGFYPQTEIPRRNTVSFDLTRRGR